MKLRSAHPKQVFRRACSLRKNGFMYREINEKLLREFPLSRKIPYSTFSTWFTAEKIQLTKKQKERIDKIKRKHVIVLQNMGAHTVHKQKSRRLNNASLDAKLTLGELIKHPHHSLLFLSGLYLGEGAKRLNDVFLIGNTNPLLLKTVTKILQSLFHIRQEKIGAAIHLRADQNEQEEMNFWSTYLNIPKHKFIKTQKDMRTLGQPTRPGYHGVCALYYYDVTIQRFLVALQNEYMRYIVTMGG